MSSSQPKQGTWVRPMQCREAAAIRERYPSHGKEAKLAIEQEIGGRSKG